MTSVEAYPTVRRMNFGFDAQAPRNKYFAEGSIMFSHMVAVLSAIFPPGEEIFVRSVRRYAECIVDADLKKRAYAFIGQEKTHGLQHRELNEQLAAMGYPTAWFEYLLGSTERMEKFLDKHYPDADRLVKLRHFFLGFTVAAEHFTAVWAENILKSPEIQATMYDPEIKNLLNWHALEELEHKSVAFDVYRSLGVPESTRIRWMRFASNFGIPILVLFSWLSIATTDIEGRRQPVRILKETVQMLRNPMWKGFYSAMKPFKKPGFHPRPNRHHRSRRALAAGALWSRRPTCRPSAMTAFSDLWRESLRGARPPRFATTCRESLPGLARIA